MNKINLDVKNRMQYDVLFYDSCNHNFLLFLIKKRYKNMNRKKNSKSISEQTLIKKNKKKENDFVFLISKSQIFTICS